MNAGGPLTSMRQGTSGRCRENFSREMTEAFCNVNREGPVALGYEIDHD